MKQLFFNFMDEYEYNINNFIVFSENMEAYYFLNRNKDEENIGEYQLIFLNGGKKCGKTHLGEIWKQKHNAKKIDYKSMFSMDYDNFMTNINDSIENFDYYLLDGLEENFDENKLFYLINTILNNHSVLLIISEFNILKYKIKMKDLKSRVYSAVHLKIKKLSKKIKPMLMIKLFADKHLFPDGDIIKYLTKKINNNYQDVYNWVNVLMDVVGEDKNKLSLSFIKKHLENK